MRTILHRHDGLRDQHRDHPLTRITSPSSTSRYSTSDIGSLNTCRRTTEHPTGVDAKCQAVGPEHCLDHGHGLNYTRPRRSLQLIPSQQVGSEIQIRTSHGYRLYQTSPKLLSSPGSCYTAHTRALSHLATWPLHLYLACQQTFDTNASMYF